MMLGILSIFYHSISVFPLTSNNHRDPFTFFKNRDSPLVRYLSGLGYAQNDIILLKLSFSMSYEMSKFASIQNPPYLNKHINGPYHY
ncbi:MAG: hypothetical protein K0S32_3786 [Bacteroidetes bacterium]|nr:hypothetical protein [Bacteroidota bacterium]